MWVIAAKNGKTYLCKYKDDNKLSSTQDINKAFQFNSKRDATNYITNQLPRSTRDNYIVISTNSNSDADKSYTETEFDWIHLRSKPVTTAFRNVGEVIKRIPSYKKALEAKKHEVEDALTDIYHYIEFNNIGTVQAYKIYKQEQELLQLRRQLKEELFCVEQLLKYVPGEKLHIEDYLQMLSNTAERTYIPKVLSDLFQPECKE